VSDTGLARIQSFKSLTNPPVFLLFPEEKARKKKKKILLNSTIK
jgi:hypothetical protein